MPCCVPVSPHTRLPPTLPTTRSDHGFPVPYISPAPAGDHRGQRERVLRNGTGPNARARIVPSPVHNISERPLRNHELDEDREMQHSFKFANEVFEADLADVVIDDLFQFVPLHETNALGMLFLPMAEHYRPYESVPGEEFEATGF